MIVKWSLNCFLVLHLDLKDLWSLFDGISRSTTVLFFPLSSATLSRLNRNVTVASTWFYEHKVFNERWTLTLQKFCLTRLVLLHFLSNNQNILSVILINLATVLSVFLNVGFHRLSVDISITNIMPKANKHVGCVLHENM